MSHQSSVSLVKNIQMRWYIIYSLNGQDDEIVNVILKYENLLADFKRPLGN